MARNRNRRPPSHIGRTYGAWTVQGRRPLGDGGNALVWMVVHVDGRIGALKHLKDPRNSKDSQRFADEINTLRRCQDIPGVIPLWDSAAATASNPAWLVMPVATPLHRRPPGISLNEVIAICHSLATTLASVHARGTSHRDIKPANILEYEGVWRLSDFGLADFPHKAAVTAPGELLGPMFYIAPEMLNAAREADGKKADVYSLGKLLWKLATGQRYPIPGTHIRSAPVYTISAYVNAAGLIPLDVLLEHMTAADPLQRPTMVEVAGELEAWSAAAPAPSSAYDLAPSTKALHAVVAPHQAKAELEEASRANATSEVQRVLAAYVPTLQLIEAKLKSAAIGSVTLNALADDNGQFFADATGVRLDELPPALRRTASVTAQINTEHCAGFLHSGFGLELPHPRGARIHDVSAPISLVGAHIMKVITRWGGLERSQSHLVWSDHDSFVLGRPTEQRVLDRIANGLRNQHAPAVAAFVSEMERVHAPREPVARFAVDLKGTRFDLVVRTERQLQGLEAATARENQVATPAEYVELVMVAWAERETEPLTPELVQSTLDRATESYAQQFLD